MDMANFDMGYLIFAIFFGSLALWSGASLLLHAYRILFLEKTLARVTLLEFRGRQRYATTLVSVSYTDLKDQDQKSKVKISSGFNTKFFDAFREKTTVKIVYNPKNGQVLLTDCLESFIVLPISFVFCLLLCLKIIPFVFK